MNYKIGQMVKRDGEYYKVYKVLKYKIFAESELGGIICINRPSYLN